VELDYVLGWALWGLGSSELLRERLLAKGDHPLPRTRDSSARAGRARDPRPLLRRSGRGNRPAR
jgi:hypothetical protein